MTAALWRRGPDDEGLWSDPEAALMLGQRQLSILDRGPGGAQPMASGCGRYVLVYNGEVYNAPELRRTLAGRGVRFRGHCDTKVVVEACAAWGPRAAVARLEEMFALTVWDRGDCVLTLARDGLGIKPLYWGLFGDLLLFASELKALLQHPGWTPMLNRDAVASFLRHGYVQAPASIWGGVWKLEPGRTMRLGVSGAPVLESFQSVAAQAAVVSETVCSETMAETVSRLETTLLAAVSRQQLSDVPVGALLSGGIDSSLVVALMQAGASRPTRSFAIGFHKDGYDEAGYAAAVAAHLGAEHTTLYVTADQARAVMPSIYDEAFADASQIPTLLLSRLARGSVTVALSGDGGDELFAGYQRYALAAPQWRRPAVCGAHGALVTGWPRWRECCQGTKRHSTAAWSAAGPSQRLSSSLAKRRAARCGMRRWRRGCRILSDGCGCWTW